MQIGLLRINRSSAASAGDDMDIIKRFVGDAGAANERPRGRPLKIHKIPLLYN